MIAAVTSCLATTVFHHPRMNPRTVFYASVGQLLKIFDVDVEAAELRQRGAVTVAANIQYAWPHPSRRYLYVVSSGGGPGVPGDKHFANAFLIDPSNGDLKPHGKPAALPSRPIHTSVDRSGTYLLTAYNDPSGLTVHRLANDGTIGAPVPQPLNLDTGIYAHQILATPNNRCVLLVTRGNNAAANKPEDRKAVLLACGSSIVAPGKPCNLLCYKMRATRPHGAR